MKAQLKNTAAVLGLGASFFGIYCTYSGDEKFYHQVIMPVAKCVLNPERSHRLAVSMAKYNLIPKFSNKTFDNMHCNVFGLPFSHPVGCAAGLDKNGEAVMGLLNVGFSFVEVGSVTPKPQPGNSLPRVFRLDKDQAIINRYGFNSDGHDVVYNRLKTINWKDKGILGVNLGVNKDSPDPASDYVKGVKKFGDLCDYLVINVSSPNTPGLRQMQKKANLQNMLTKVLKAREELSKKTPLLLKISPDESEEDLNGILEVVKKPECRIDGLIVTNTTVSRDNLLSPPSLTSEVGGLSGKPLAEKSTKIIAYIAKVTHNSIPIIGVGGIDNGDEAWLKLMAGASLVQLYTAFTFYGPPIVKKVTNELNSKLEQSDYKTMENFVKSREKLPHLNK